MGYAGIASENNSAPLVGAVFAPVSGAETYDLSDLSIPGYLSGKRLIYADPGSEFIRFIDPNSSATTARYTYVAKEFIIDNFDLEEEDDWKEYSWAIGWWVYDPEVDYQELIEGGQDDLKVKTAVPVSNGQAFIGKFSKGHTISLQSNGEVVTEQTAFETKQNSAPIFCNFLPVDIDLSDITIPGYLSGKRLIYADPGSEFIRFLDPNSSATTARYTYIAKEFILDNFDLEEEDDWMDYAWAIGWWVYDPDVDYQELIEGGEDNLKVKTAIPVTAGRGFIGKFSKGHTLNITLPGALDVGK